MNDKQNFPDKLCSDDNFHCNDPRRHFYRQQDAQATSTKTLLSEPVYDIASLIENPPFLQSQFPFMIYAKNVQTPNIAISSNNANINIESVEGFDCGITSQPTHKVPAGETCMPNFEVAKNNHGVPARKKLLQFGSASHTFVDDHSSCKQNTDCGITSRPNHKVSSSASFIPNFEAAMYKHAVPPENNLHPFRHAEETFLDFYSLAEQNSEQHFGNEYMKRGNLRRDERILLSEGENERLKNNFSSSGNGKDQYIPNAFTLNVANQLLAVSEGNNSQVEHFGLKFKKDDGVLSNERGIVHIDNEYSLSGNGNEHYTQNPAIWNMAIQLLTSGGNNSEIQTSQFIDKKENERGINHIDNEYSLTGNGNEHYIQNPAIWNMAIQLLTSRGNNSRIQTSQFIDKKENESLSSGHAYKQVQNDMPCIDDKLFVLSGENYTEVSNQDFIKHLPQNEISVKYCQFYSQISPQDYDFAMNIMAYIELLNDCTWNATVTYFEENIKNMVRYVWDQNKNAVNSNSMLGQCYQDDFLNAMEYFSEFASKKNYKIGEFLEYCVMMCQLGVFARKRNFKEAPLHVIDYLRQGISNIEHCQSIIFEIDIKNYAQELSEHAQM